MIKSIAIQKTNKAFLPEAYAYRDYFQANGLVCEIVSSESNDILQYDAVLLFHGFHPFWKRYPDFIISDYNSLSTGKFNRLKDVVKRVLNVRGDFHIFLNENVRKNMFFSSKINYTIRGMGYSANSIKLENVKKEFDIVYCGSYRPGIDFQIEKLAALGFKMAVVGFEYKSDNTNIRSFGRVEPYEAMNIITQSKYGLNYTPDIFPLNIQDSTKVIEYCAAGLGVITNRYKWINDFEKDIGANFLSIDNIKTIKDVTDFNFQSGDIANLSWTSVLESSNIMNKIREIIDK